MAGAIRPYRPADQEVVVELAIRAWGPVFASLERVLGREMFRRLHGDRWEDFQREAVRGVLADPGMNVQVADCEASVAGFVATQVDRERLIGEIVMVAVDPGWQGRGFGGALTEFATEWLREQGMRVAMVETGGDRGHAAARHVYERAGYRLLPVARYFKNL